MERRLEEAMRLGFRSAVIPERQAAPAEGAKAKKLAIQCIGSSTLREAIDRCLAPGAKRPPSGSRG
jgi:predicted ATP-dependent serine protease